MSWATVVCGFCSAIWPLKRWRMSLRRLTSLSTRYGGTAPDGWFSSPASAPSGRFFKISIWSIRFGIYFSAPTAPIPAVARPAICDSRLGGGVVVDVEV